METTIIAPIVIIGLITGCFLAAIYMILKTKYDIEIKFNVRTGEFYLKKKGHTTNGRTEGK